MGPANTILKFVVMAILPVLLLSNSGRAEQSLTSAHFVIQYSNIDEEAAKNLANQAEKAFLAITSYLSRSYAKPILIDISDDHRFPKFDKSNGRIIIPANRIRGDAKGPTRLRKRGTALVSVLIDVIAPSANPRWGGFLQAGFRVFMQEKFGPKNDKSFPSMGRDLHKETVRMVRNYGRFIPLSEAEKARTWRKRLSRTRHLAYLEEGSFVRFLIEKSGLKLFLKLYDGGSFEEVYGIGISVLETDWKKSLESAS